MTRSRQQQALDENEWFCFYSQLAEHQKRPSKKFVLTDDERYCFANTNIAFITNIDRLKLVLDVLPIERRLQFIMTLPNNNAIITKVDNIELLVDTLSQADRLPFCLAYLAIIRNQQALSKLTNKLEPKHQHALNNAWQAQRPNFFNKTHNKSFGTCGLEFKQNPPKFP